jgi:Fe-S-cluster-containing hydrogenase component 2
VLLVSLWKSVYKPLWSHSVLPAAPSFKLPPSHPSTRLLALFLLASCGHRVCVSVCNSPPIVVSCLPYYTLVDYCSRCHLPLVVCSCDMVSHHRQQPPPYQFTVHSSRHMVYLPSLRPLFHPHTSEPMHQQPQATLLRYFLSAACLLPEPKHSSHLTRTRSHRMQRG